MTEDTTEERAAHKRIEDAIYALTRRQREGLDASTLRNVITDLWPAIVAEMRKVGAEQKDGDAVHETTQQKIEEVKRRLAGMSTDERAETIRLAIAHAVPHDGAPHSLSGHGHGLGESVKANGHDLIVVEEQILRCGNGETCVDFAVDAAGYIVAIESRLR